LTAVVVHFGIYYGPLTPYMQTETRNPGVAAAIAIAASLFAGTAVVVATRIHAKRRGQQTVEAVG